MTVQRFHRSAGNRSLPCTATVRACPRKHYDTPKDAQSPRQRLVKVQNPTEHILPFTAHIGEGEKYDDGLSPKNLRESSEHARSMFLQYGQRPCSPYGTISVNLNSEYQLRLTRETFNSSNASNPVGARYYVRLARRGIIIKEDLLSMNTQSDLRQFETMVQSYFTRSAPGFTIGRRQVLGEDFREKYDSAMQVISEIEVMARGSQHADEQLGLKLFAEDEIGTLTLDTTYSNSALQPYDISDALGVHAQKDHIVKNVSIAVHDEAPGGTWTVSRLPEGDWFVGTVSDKGTASQAATTPQELSERLTEAMERVDVPESQRSKIIDFSTHLVQETERAVASYEKTAAPRIASAQAAGEDIAPKAHLTFGEKRRLERQEQSRREGEEWRKRQAAPPKETPFSKLMGRFVN